MDGGSKLRVYIFIAILLSGTILSACSNPFSNRTILDVVKKHYTINDTVKSSVDSSDTARIFTAKNKSINQVKSVLTKEMKPSKVSDKANGKQALVYDNYIVTLTQDDKNPKNTNIEVATYGFVRDNYRPSFFQGLLTYYFLSHLFGVNNWASRQNSRCIQTNGCYRGYNQSGGRYKGPGSKPLFRSSTFRGGGPNAGK